MVLLLPVGLARVLSVGLLVLSMRAVGLLVMGRHDSLATSQVDVDTAGVVLGSVLQAEFAADLLNARLDLLDMVG